MDLNVPDAEIDDDAVEQNDLNSRGMNKENEEPNKVLPNQQPSRKSAAVNKESMIQQKRKR